MLKKGLKQVEIAKKLGIGESAVSLYLKSKRAAKIKFDKEIDKELDKAVENILKGKNVIKQIQLLCNKIRKTRLICKISHSLGKMPENLLIIDAVDFAVPAGTIRIFESNQLSSLII